VLPLLAHLALAANLRAVWGRRRGYLRLFLPDYMATATLCGGFALAWGALRSVLVLRALRGERCGERCGERHPLSVPGT
jgi:hypothetical protein